MELYSMQTLCGYTRTLFFPQKETRWLLFVRLIFIACNWVNLDFGIETYLTSDLSAFWKTWLQFLFPLYIWLIAGVIIVACRYSFHLTNLIGNRVVPLLATLFHLAYTKLICTSTTIFNFGVLTVYTGVKPKKLTVWYLDGNLRYYQHPHSYLFIMAIATMILCLTVTFFLLLVQCLRKVSHLRLLRWINRLTPFYDAYLAPLKCKHHITVLEHCYYSE